MSVRWLLIALHPDGTESILSRSGFLNARSSQESRLNLNNGIEYYIIKENKYHPPSIIPSPDLQGSVRHSAALGIAQSDGISGCEVNPPRRRVPIKQASTSSKQDKVVWKMVNLATAHFMLKDAYVVLEPVQ